jgi:hypothetical protein
LTAPRRPHTPGFAAADCRPVIGNDISRAVVWKGGDLSAVAGKPVRLALTLKDADVYAFRFAGSD